MKLFKNLLISFCLVQTASAQTFHLPPLDSLYLSVDAYYSELTQTQIHELKEENKGRWLNYIPSPGYSPFAGGFTVNFNVAAPIQEAKARSNIKRKIESLQRLNDLAAQQLKYEVLSEYEAVKLRIYTYYTKERSAEIRKKLFEIVQTQYDRKEITPTAYFAKLLDEELFAASRTHETYEIQRAILLLNIKAKRKPESSSFPAFAN